MNFLRISEQINLPVIDSSHNCVCIASQDYYVPAYELYELKLGFLLLSLPKNHLVQIIENNTAFKILTKFWLASPNMLTLPIITPSPCHIHIGEILCRIQLLPIYVFLPGTLVHNFVKFSIVN